MRKLSLAFISLDLLLFLFFVFRIFSISGWLVPLWGLEICLSTIWGWRVLTSHRQKALEFIFLIHHGEHPKDEYLEEFTLFVLGFFLLLPSPLAMVMAWILLPPPIRRHLGRKSLSWYEQRHPPLIIDQQ